MGHKRKPASAGACTQHPGPASRAVLPATTQGTECSAPTRKPSHAPNPTNHVPTPPGKQVLKEEMSADPLYLRGGATIPALALFQKHLGADTAVFGFGLPDGGAHAPNEHLPEGMYHLAQRAYVKLYHALAAKPGDGAGADRSEL